MNILKNNFSEKKINQTSFLRKSLSKKNSNVFKIVAFFAILISLSFTASAAGPLAGTNNHFDLVRWVNQSNEFATQLSDAISPTPNDVNLTNNITYFGMRYKMRQLNLSVSTASGGAAEGDVAWELHNGTGWQLLNLNDSNHVTAYTCGNFSQVVNCTLRLDINIIDEWVNGTPSGIENSNLNLSLYWIRVRNRSAWTAIPALGQASGLSYNLEINVTDELGNVLRILDNSDSLNVSSNNSGGVMDVVKTGGQLLVAVTNVTHTLTVNNTGYVAVATTSQDKSDPEHDSNLTTTSVSLPYGLKIFIQNELGFNVTGPSPVETVRFRGNAPNTSSVSGVAIPTYYFNDTSGVNGALFIERNGFVIINVTNSGLNNITTTTATQITVTLGNYSANNSLTINSNVSLKGLQYAHRINLTDELGFRVNGTGVKIVNIAGPYNNNCLDDASTGFFYCQYNTSETEVLFNMTKDGFVRINGTFAIRNANSSAQVTNNITNMLYAHVVNATTELVSALTGATVKIGSTSCIENGSSGYYYCSVPSPDDAVVNDINVTKNGYVESLGTSLDRSGNGSLQQNNNLSNIRFGIKVVLQREVDGVSLSTAVVNVSNNTATGCVENGTTGTYYCAVLLTNTNTTVTVAKSGFVNSTSFNAYTARNNHSSTQQVANMTNIQFGLKVTVADELGSNLTGIVARFKGGVADINTTTSFYWNNTGGGPGQLLITKDGYVQSNVTNSVLDSVNVTDVRQIALILGNFSANSTGSLIDNTSMKGLEFSHKVNSSTELLTVLTNATVSIGSVSCSYDAYTTFYYCIVPVGSDAVTNDVNSTLDGYVQTYGTSGNRTANSSVQQITNISMNFAHKVYPKHELGSNLTNATVTIGATTCTASGPYYYCAVGVGNDVVTNDINVTLNGYVEALSTSGNRTAQNSSQIQDNLTDIRFALKVLATKEVSAAALTGATINVSNNSATECMENGTTGTYYCAVLLTNTNTTVALIKTGFVNYTSYSAYTARNNHSSAQQAANVTNVLFGLKVVLADELGNNITNLTGVVSLFRGGLFDLNTTSTFYWNDTVGSGGGLVLTKDGYVQSNITNTALSNITTGSAKQRVITLGNFSANSTTGISDNTSVKGMQFSHRVNASTELLVALSNATVVIGSISCSYDASTGNYYCAVPVGSDAVTNDINVTKNGYVELAGTSGNRTANTSDQITNNLTIRFSHKVTLKREHMNDSLTGAVMTAGSSLISCSENGTTGEYFCAINLTHDGGTGDVVVFTQGYINTTGSTQNRAVHNDSQQVVNITGVQFAFKLVGVYDESLSQWMKLDGTASNGSVAVQSAGLTALVNYTNGTHALIAANGSAVNFTFSRRGWVNRTISSVSYNSAVQQTVFVGNTSVLAFNTSNATGAAMLFTVRVVLRDELLNDLTGVTINLTNTTNTVATTTPTNTSGNIQYFAVNLTLYPTINITSRATGYVTVFDTNNSVNYTVTDHTQINATHNLSFSVKINATNELGTVLNLTSGNTTIILSSGLVNQSPIRYSGGFAYISANTSVGTIELAVKGYVNSTTNNLFPNTTLQTVVNFTGAPGTATAVGRGLPYTLRLAVTSSTTGNAISTPSVTVSSSGQTDLYPSQTSGSSHYVAADATAYSTVNISVSKTGYTSGQEFNLALTNASQTNLTFSLLGDSSVPGTPTLLLPENITKVNTTIPVLSWTAVTDSGSGVRYYHLLVSNVSNLSSPAINRTNITSSGYSVTASDSLISGQLYYWRVRGVDDANNTGEWSNVYQFTVNTTQYNFTYSFSRIGWHVFQFLPKTVVENNLSSLGGNFTVRNVLTSINNKYTIVYHYNGSTYTSYVPGRSVNDLSEMNNTSPWYTINMNSTGTLEIV